jgi:ABC-type transport system involved in multi-copper enzyme maturation permease subunit
MRGLIRQQRSRSVLTFYMVGLTVVTFLLYETIISANAFNPDPDVRRTLGKIIFLSTTLMQFAVIIFIAPLFSADSITTERENKTFDLLRSTSISESSIVRGKLLARILFTLLLLLISLPLQSSAILLGGITSLEFLLTVLILVTTTIFLCSVSIYATSRAQQTSSAIGLAYAIAGAVLLGFPILAYVMIKLVPFPSDQAVFDVLDSISKNLAPILQIILVIVIWLLISTNPISAAIVSYNLFLDEGVRVLYDPKAFPIRIPFLAPWITFIILYLLISWLFYQASVRQIKRSNKL